MTKIPRWLYAITFGGFGLMHLTMGDDLTGYVPGFLPGGVFWVYLTGHYSSEEVSEDDNPG